MQLHLDGFRTGNPHDFPAASELSDSLPDTVDVLIIGCGPAGLTLAAQLSQFAGINTRIVEQKDGPLQLGQADGVNCRSMEMFEAFSFSERVMREAYWVNETVFWGPATSHPYGIERTGRIQDVEDDLSEFPHVILNQARVHDMYLDVMRQSPRKLVPDYNLRFLSLDTQSDKKYVTVKLQRMDEEENGLPISVRARYVVGCDGARSEVRKAIGLSLTGDSANQAWGVMDLLAVTDFPDIRFKSVIRSGNEGNLLIIPREGGYLARFYIELDKLAPDERVADRHITSGHLVAAANRILHPYHINVKEIPWWSVYQIGQRLCSRFDDVPEEMVESCLPRVFIAGDACHTHSPKAGLGMNVSMADAFNLGWKLAAVLRGQAKPELLRSYSDERHRVAADLIEFDGYWAERFSERTGSTDGEGNSMDNTEFQQFFSRHGRFTAGMTVRYNRSMLTGNDTHQALASGLTVGMRFHSAPVIRIADARLMQLGHTVKADGRWRLFAFANSEEPSDQQSQIWNLCDFLSTDPASPMLCYQYPGDNQDAFIDFRAVFQQDHRNLETQAMHPFLLPAKGKLGLQDQEKMFSACQQTAQDIYTLRGISRDGCLLLVRPDQYVAALLPLSEPGLLVEFFKQVANPVQQ